MERTSLEEKEALSLIKRSINSENSIITTIQTRSGRDVPVRSVPGQFGHVRGRDFECFDSTL